MSPKSKSKPPLPVDRGWAWWVMIGFFINMYIVISWIRCLAILLPVFLDKYQQSTAMTTLAFGISELAETLSHVLLSLVFINRFTVRTITLVGATANAFAILLLYVSSDIASLNVIFAVIGFARGFMINPPVYLLGAYFKKRLPFASSFGNTGTSVATLSAPLLTQLLLTSFGLEGTFLMFGGIAMHSIISSFLFRPTSLYICNEEVYTLPEEQGSESDDLDKTSLSSSSLPLSLSSSKPPFSSSNPSVNTTAKDIHIEHNPSVQLNTTPNPLYQTSNLHDSNIKLHNHNDKLSSQQLSESNRQPTTIDNNVVTCSNKRAILKSENEMNREYPKDTDTGTRRDPNSSDLNYTNDDDCCGTETETLLYENSPSTEECTTRERTSVKNSAHNLLRRNVSKVADKEVEEGSEDVESTDQSGQQKQTVTAWEVLRNPTAVCIMMAGILGTQTQCGNVYMPVLGLENGLTSDQLPWLLTITGASDIIGKLIFGFVADRGWLQPINVVCLCLFNAGLVFQLVSYFQGMLAMTTLCVLFGIHAGMVQALLPPISVQYAGLPSLPHIISGMFLGNCVLTFTAHLAVGALRDLTGSFKWGFRFVGMLMLSAVVFFLAVRWRAWRHKAGPRSRQASGSK